ncbi:hypothetical protein [Rubritalea tangerina]|uniref:hypothetical protein n=1 Tax=Rubritalea tangerina TaxID=430798 RepID=UPI003611B558
MIYRSYYRWLLGVCGVHTQFVSGCVMRIRKGWKHAAVLVSHFSMLALMVGGAVTYHQSKEAYMLLSVERKVTQHSV